MFEKSLCPVCGTELTGVIVSTFVKDGASYRIVSQETTDCNWVRCEGCLKALCKKCNRTPEHSCAVDRTVTVGLNGHGFLANLGDALKRLSALINKSKNQNQKN